MNYRNHYNAIIVRALTRAVPEGYTESHHILPRCMGGTDDPANLVRLTAREHFVAHQLLVKMHPEHPGLALAATFLRKRRDGTEVGNSHAYGWLKERHARAVSEKMKAVWSNPEYREAGAERSRDLWSNPEYVAKLSGENHHFNRNPESRANHQVSVKSESYRAQFRGAGNPMVRPDVAANHLEAVRTPEQRAVRRDNMNKLNSDPAFAEAHAARLVARTTIITKGNLMFGGQDAACRYFGISKPTLAKHIKTGDHGFAKVGTIGDTPDSVPGGYAKNGLWFEDTPERAEKLPHGLCGKPSNAH